MAWNMVSFGRLASKRSETMQQAEEASLFLSEGFHSLTGYDFDAKPQNGNSYKFSIYTHITITHTSMYR